MVGSIIKHFQINSNHIFVFGNTLIINVVGKECNSSAFHTNMMFYLCEFDVDGFRCDYCDVTPEEFWIEAKKE